MLYKESRPLFFRDSLGQEHITGILLSQVKNDKLAHAMMFTGIRGTGKTTFGKLIAKAVNCEEPNDGEPCGVCQSCVDADAGQHMDIYEIDAASNNGVDDVRAMKEDVTKMPYRNKKVIIIDEAHMLSNAAFNALLKLIEEPPAHVIFIFATTEPHKVLPTIRSRCQIFNLKRMDNDVIISGVVRALQKFGYAVPDRVALELIAKLSGGSMRDALSITDSLLNHDKSVAFTIDDIERQQGLVNQESMNSFVKLMLSGDKAETFKLLMGMYEDGLNTVQFVSSVEELLKDCLVMRSGADISMPSSYVSALGEMVSMASESTLYSVMNAFRNIKGKNVGISDIQFAILSQMTAMADTNDERKVVIEPQVVEMDEKKIRNFIQDEIKKVYDLIEELKQSGSKVIEPHFANVQACEISKPFVSTLPGEEVAFYSRDVADRKVSKLFTGVIKSVTDTFKSKQRKVDVKEEAAKLIESTEMVKEAFSDTMPEIDFSGPSYVDVLDDEDCYNHYYENVSPEDVEVSVIDEVTITDTESEEDNNVLLGVFENLMGDDVFKKVAQKGLVEPVLGDDNMISLISSDSVTFIWLQSFVETKKQLIKNMFGVALVAQKVD